MMTTSTTHGTPEARQRMLARTHQADGQCRGCGAFRLDGQPPTVHFRKCVYGPDGSAFEPLYTLPPNRQRPNHATPSRGKPPTGPRSYGRSNYGQDGYSIQAGY